MQNQLVILLIGALFGWLLNQLAQWYKGKKEDNRIRKEVLFYLLEFRYLLSQINIKPIVNVFYGKIESKIPIEIQTEEFKLFVKQFILTQYAPVMKEKIDAQFPIVKDGFSKVVNKLSSVDPIQAYKLSGQEEIINQGELILKMFDNIDDEYLDNNFKRKTISTVNDSLFTNSEKTLEDLINVLSRKISHKTYKEAQEVVFKIKNKMHDPIAEEQINQFLKNVQGVN